MLECPLQYQLSLSPYLFYPDQKSQVIAVQTLKITFYEMKAGVLIQWVKNRENWE